MANDWKWGWAGGGANRQTPLQVAMEQERARWRRPWHATANRPPIGEAVEPSSRRAAVVADLTAAMESQHRMIGQVPPLYVWPGRPSPFPPARPPLANPISGPDTYGPIAKLLTDNQTTLAAFRELCGGRDPWWAFADPGSAYGPLKFKTPAEYQFKTPAEYQLAVYLFFQVCQWDKAVFAAMNQYAYINGLSTLDFPHIPFDDAGSVASLVANLAAIPDQLQYWASYYKGPLSGPDWPTDLVERLLTGQYFALLVTGVKEGVVKGTKNPSASGETEFIDLGAYWWHWDQDHTDRRFIWPEMLDTGAW